MRERDRARYRTDKRRAWTAEFQQTQEFKEANYARTKAWRARPESKPKRAEEARKWRARHPDTMAEIKRRFREKHRERLREEEKLYQRARREADPAGQKRIERAYKVRREAKLVEMAGRPRPDVCDICGENNRYIVFDHCHAKGHFRGWLCDRCNKVLGIMKDDATLLRKMADYLER